MGARSTIRTRQREAGIALLISIFILLLISVVAIALVVSSGTESALAGNYRSATGVYYAALSGLEEARGRLLVKNPDAFATTNASNFLPPSGTALAMGATYYLINPIGGEAIRPWDSTSTYADNQFAVEFGPTFTAPTNPSPAALSVWNRNPLLALNLPGPLYKWVRINAVSEKSLGVDADADGLADSTTPLYYNGSNFSNNPSAGPQVLELTAFAILPNGSQKVLQYLVASESVTLTFPAALTLDGYSDVFSSPDHSAFQVRGDADSGDSACAPSGSIPYPVYGIAVPDPPDVNNVKNGIPVTPVNETGNFTGMGIVPSVAQVSLATNLQTVQSLNQLAQTIVQNADSVISDPAGNANQSNLPSAMSSANPMTIAVQGDPLQPVQGNFYLGPGFTGYGLLLVTGNFTYATDSNWNGIVLVIGQGTVTAIESNPNGAFNGAMLVARTRNSSGLPLPGPNPGSASFTDTVAPHVGQGIFYNCGWIQAAQLKTPYKILSFHEISQ
jgi:hypothetical protein